MYCDFFSVLHFLWQNNQTSTFCDRWRQTSKVSCRNLTLPTSTRAHHVASCCIMLHHIASYCIMLHHVASCCIMLHISVNVLWLFFQFYTFCDRFVSHIGCHVETIHHLLLRAIIMLHHVASCYIMLHHVSVLLQHIATYCIILQHIATYCNILQHIASFVPYYVL